MRLRILLVVAALVGCKSPNQTKPARQRLSPVQIFDLRTKCQSIVDKDVEDLSIGVVGAALTADVTSHYNPVTNHCYAEVNVSKNLSLHYPETPDNYWSSALYDAQTRQLLFTAQRNGDKTSGIDLRDGFVTSNYEKVRDQIHELMTQEDEN